MLQTQLRILRVFGPTSAEVTAVLRAAQADGCPGLRLLERDGEFAVCVQASAPTQLMAENYCDKWSQKLSARFGDALYATGEISLAQAALDALLKKRKLIVAADEATGRLLGGLLQPLAHSEAAFDFGTQTYANPEVAKKIVTPPSVLKKFPGDVIQAAAGRAQLAMLAGNADYAAAYMPATVGQAPFVLLCDKKGTLARAVNPDLSDAAIGNSILDLARRRALGLHPGSDTVSFKPGHESPLLIVSKAGQVSPLTDTLRFSLRRAKKAPDTQDFEPMLDFSEGEGGKDQPMAFPSTAPAAGAAPTMPRAGAARAAGSIVFEEPTPTHPRLRKAGAATGQPAPRTPMESTLTPPVSADLRPLPEDSFSGQPPETRDAPMDVPVTPYTAPAETQTATGASVGRFTQQLDPAEDSAFEDAFGNDAGLAVPAARQAGRTINRAPARPAPTHSILDDDIPDFKTPEPDTIPPAAEERGRDIPNKEAGADFKAPPTSVRPAKKYESAAHKLFDPSSPEDVADPIKNKSLAIIEKSERRQRRTMALVLTSFLLVLLAGAGALFFYFRGYIGTKPSSRSYGTAAFDNKASAYLAKAVKKQSDVAGYLAFPGVEGELVYTAEHPLSAGKTAFGGQLHNAAAATATAESAAPRLEENRLGNAASNTMLNCGGTALSGITTQQNLVNNAGFTLYTAAGTYRCKVMAVYYWDPAEQGAGSFSALTAGPSATYTDYLSLVLGLRVRTLYDTDVDLPENSRFLTLYSDSGQGNFKVCVTGRVIEEGEDAQLITSSITKNENPLLTAVQYAGAGKEQPEVPALLANAMSWYAGRTLTQAASAPADEESAATEAEGVDTGELTQQAAEMAANTQAVLAAADKLLAGLTDVAGNANAVETSVNQGAEGNLPEKTVAVTALATAAPTPTAAPTSAPDTAQAETPAAEPTAAPAASAEGETINVTMNGSQQTLDLVQCLAMIAQNELGPNAPAEAYKAQCVAAHCWIISQSGYPSVAGLDPGSAALAAAQEVAHVLVTYNGNVCFTPYFASASTGTASSADVWGNDRAWLQAVDSPYDKDVSSNWNTNGNNTGCARFSRETLAARINEKLGIDLSGTDPNSWFKILSANQYGWVTQMQVGPDGGNNTACSGRWFREVLTAGQSVDGRSLRSQCFTFTYDSGLDCFIFDVYGYGHGCGLSQWGAIGYANNGWDYQAILTHYYPGTAISTY